MERAIQNYQQLSQDVLEPEVEILTGPSPTKIARVDNDDPSTEAAT